MSAGEWLALASSRLLTIEEMVEALGAFPELQAPIAQAEARLRDAARRAEARAMVAAELFPGDAYGSKRLAQARQREARFALFARNADPRDGF